MTEKRRFLYRTFWCLVALLCLVILSTTGCRSTGSPLPSISHDVVKYTKYNIHAHESRRDIKASYAGYVDSGIGHFVIPAGSKVTFPDKRSMRNGFFISIENTGDLVFFEYNRDRMGMSEREYIELITSDSPVSLDGFSEIDRKGIEEGKVYKGMTKQGVLTAFGYPAVHGTPSLEMDRWKYWRNRFTTMDIEFDSTGNVIDIIH